MQPLNLKIKVTKVNNSNRVVGGVVNKKKASGRFLTRTTTLGITKNSDFFSKIITNKI